MAYLKTGTNEEEQDPNQPAQGTTFQASSGQAENATPNQGAATGANAPQGMGSAPNTDFTQTNTSTGKKILEKNAGDNSFDITKPFQAGVQKGYSDIAANQQAHQQDVEGKVNATKFGNDQVKSAIEGGGDDYSKIQSAIQQPTQFASYTQATLPEIAGAQSLNTSAGLQSELQRQANQSGNYNYNQGQSALDAAIMGRNQQAQQNIAGLQKQYGDLYGKQAAAATEEKNREDAANAQIAKNQADIKTALSGVGSGLDTQTQQSAQAAQQNAEGNLSSTWQDYIRKYAASPGLSDVQKNDILNSAGFGWNGNVNNEPPALKLQDFTGGSQNIGNMYTQPQLDEYSRIANLMGSDYAAPTNVGNITAKDIDYGKLNAALANVSKGAGDKEAASASADATKAAAAAQAAKDQADAEQRDAERRQQRPQGVLSTATKTAPNKIAGFADQNSDALNNALGTIVPVVPILSHANQWSGGAIPDINPVGTAGQVLNGGNPFTNTNWSAPTNVSVNAGSNYPNIGNAINSAANSGSNYAAKAKKGPRL